MINISMNKEAVLLYIKREIIDRDFILSDIVINDNGTAYVCFDENDKNLFNYIENFQEEFYIFNISDDVLLDIKENILDKGFIITDLDITKQFVLVSYIEQ